MKNNVLTHILLFFSLFSFSEFMLSGQQTADNVVMERFKKMDTILNVWERTYCEPQKNVFHGTGTTLPSNTIRIIYRKIFDKDKPKEGSKLPVDPDRTERFDQADFLLVPQSDPTFKLAQILKQNKPQETADGMFVQQYGIRWVKKDSEYKSYILYLGADDLFHYFGRGNLAALDLVAETLQLKNAVPDRAKLLTDAMKENDDHFFTSRYAVGALVRMGNTALPALKKSLEQNRLEQEPPVPQMMAIRQINTPEAYACMTEELLKINDAYIRDALFEAARVKPYLKELKKIYLQMIREHRLLSPALEAVFEFQWQVEALPLFRDVVQTPRNFEEYYFSLLAVQEMRRTKKDKFPIHAAALDHIKLFAIRNGDVRNTPVMRKVAESDEAREVRLEKEDRVRLQPYEDAIVNAPEQELSIAAGLILCLFDTKDERVSRQYINRIRRSGMNILLRLPRKNVENAFRSFLSNFEDEEELKTIRNIYSLYRVKTLKN